MLVGFELQKWATYVRPTSLRALDAFSYGLVPLIVLIATLSAISIMFRDAPATNRNSLLFGATSLALLGVGQTIMVFGQRAGLRSVELQTQWAALAACCVATCLVAFAWRALPGGAGVPSTSSAPSGADR